MADYRAQASSYQSSSNALANTLIGTSTLIDCKYYSIIFQRYIDLQACTYIFIYTRACI